jgi:cytoskeletal protein RodZ
MNSYLLGFCKAELREGFLIKEGIMKKYRSLIIPAILLSLVGLLWFVKLKTVNQNRSAPQQTQEIGQPLVEVSIENGETTATEKNANATTAFDALVVITQKQQLSLKTKTYDFGIFVEQIGILANTKEKAWVYFVNGKSGTVAADKQTLKAGDKVEWKYIKPIF